MPNRLHGAHIAEVEEQNKRLQMLLCELLRTNHELRLEVAQHSQLDSRINASWY
jgi:hypothetical protein